MMVMGAKASRWRTKEALRRAVGAAQPVARAEVHSSEGLRITRVATQMVGAYFIVTESDALFQEDGDALNALSVELRAPWRNRVVETDFWDHPHPQFPLSNSFRVHLVHPEYRPEWEAHGRQAHACGKYDEVRQSA